MLASISPAHQRLEAQLQTRLGSDLAVVCTGVDGDPQSLWPEEQAVVAQAIPRRQREFAAGRAAARAAMARLGWAACAIPAFQDRSPAWPEGLVGSITHSAHFCVAVVGLSARWASVGVDIEEDQRIEADVWPSICVPGELDALTRAPEPTRKTLVTRLFGAKEAFFKWQYPGTRQMLDFQDVQIRLSADGETFVAWRLNDRHGAASQSVAQGLQLLAQGQVLSLVAHRAHQQSNPAAASDDRHSFVTGVAGTVPATTAPTSTLATPAPSMH